MIGQWLKRRKDRQEKARALYFAAASQARQPAFYQEMGVPDTVDGRFEMTALHVFLVMNALGADNKALAQALFDRMFKVNDQTMRQAGIGDLSVPRHMKRMMTAFNGRAHAYANALQNGQMADALRRNVYGTMENAAQPAMARLENYVLECARALATQDVASGRVAFASPDMQPQEMRRHG